MKFNFRKIASVMTSAVMLLSTAAFAAAANFPAPFVSSGAGTYAVVYGSAAPQGTDSVQATNINTFLQQSVTVPAATPATTNSTVITGDVVQLAQDDDNFNLGDRADAFDNPIDNDAETGLPVVLADGTYYNKLSNDFEYEQTIDMGGWIFNWTQDSNYNSEKPFAGVEFAAGDPVLNYTLTFKTAAQGVDTDFSKLDSTVITMMGRDFYISNAEAVATTGLQLTLLDTANSVTIPEGETQTITLGGVPYAIKVVSVNDDTPDTVTLSVNGVELNTDLAAGDTAKVPQTDVYVGAKKVRFVSKEGSASSATITLGTGQLVLGNGVEAELNGDLLSSVDGYKDYTLKSYFENTTTNLNSITLEWKAKRNNKLFLSPGTAITMPGLNTIKVQMGDFVVPTGEETMVQGGDGEDSLQVSTVLKDGAADIEVAYQNSSDTGFGGLGSDTDEVLATSGTQSPDDDISSQGNVTDPLTVALDTDGATRVVVTWIDGDNAESAYYELASVTDTDGGNETVLDNLAEGAGTITLEKVTDTDRSTHVVMELMSADSDNENASIKLTPKTGKVYVDRVVTDAGLQFTLPSNASTISNGFDITFTEKDAENDNIAAGASFTVSVDASDDGAEPTAVAGVKLYPAEKSSREKIGYVESDLATYVDFNDAENAQGSLTLTAHDSEVYGKFYVSEAAATVSNGGGNGAGTLVVTDAQVLDVSSKNLIVIGGSCVNTVAAKLIDATATAPICGADWTTKTNVGAGAFLIQTFTSPYAADKIATLVAGYEAADTENAVNALKVPNTIDTTAGKKYVKLASSTLQLV